MRESLVVAEIQIGFGAVVGNEYFTMLKRTHGARIDVQIRIEFLQSDTKAAAFEEAPDGRRSDSLPQRRNHAARDENILSHNKPTRYSYQ